jgi:hypothetical protein
LPVLGIRRILGDEPDCWSVHDRDLDFDFVNRHYRYVIVGGAGLLDKGFEPFWAKFARECRLPTVIWGVGICAPDRATQKGVDRDVFARAARKCALINFRDDLTADYYTVRQATIAPCPTIAYLEGLDLHKLPAPDGVLYSSHEELVCDDEREQIRCELRRGLGRVNFTDNVQRRLNGLGDIIRRSYQTSRLVITTRLHGAIIAYGLGIPYIALPRDEKLRAFHRLFGNGVAIEDVAGLREALGMRIPRDKPIQYGQVHEFGASVRAWVSSLA